MFNKEKMMKWAVCVGFGIVLSWIAMLIVNYAYDKQVIVNIQIVFFIVHIIWLCLILSNPIQAKIQNKTYGVIASITVSIVLATLLTSLSTIFAYYRFEPGSSTEDADPGFMFIILIAAYSIMTYAIAAKIESKK